MNSDMRSRERINSRDLITIGIFNALILVVFLGLQAILQPIPGMGVFNGGLVGFLMAPLYLLLAVRVRKFGVFTITSVLYSLLLAAIGFYPAILPVLVGGLVADLLGVFTGFQNMAGLITAYVAYKIFEGLGNMSVYVINPQRFAANMPPAAREQFMQGVALFTVWAGVLILVLTVVGCTIGGVMAARLLRKHFERAGLLTA